MGGRQELHWKLIWDYNQIGLGKRKKSNYPISGMNTHIRSLSHIHQIPATDRLDTDFRMQVALEVKNS